MADVSMRMVCDVFCVTLNEDEQCPKYHDGIIRYGGDVQEQVENQDEEKKKAEATVNEEKYDADEGVDIVSTDDDKEDTFIFGHEGRVVIPEEFKDRVEVISYNFQPYGVALIEPPDCKSVDLEMIKKESKLTQEMEKIDAMVEQPGIENVEGGSEMEKMEFLAVPLQIEKMESLAVPAQMEKIESLAEPPQMEKMESLAVPPQMEKIESLAVPPQMEKIKSLAVPPQTEKIESLAVPPQMEKIESLAVPPQMEKMESLPVPSQMEKIESLAVPSHMEKIPESVVRREYKDAKYRASVALDASVDGKMTINQRADMFCTDISLLMHWLSILKLAWKAGLVFVKIALCLFILLYPLVAMVMIACTLPSGCDGKLVLSPVDTEVASGATAMFSCATDIYRAAGVPLTFHKTRPDGTREEIYISDDIFGRRGSRFRADRPNAYQLDIYIDNVTEDDSGNYTCTDDQGRGESASAQLKVVSVVAGALDRVDRPKNVTVPLGGTAIFTCRTKTSAPVNWERTTEAYGRQDVYIHGEIFGTTRNRLKFVVNHSLSDPGLYILTVKNVTHADAGTYTCIDNHGVSGAEEDSALLSIDNASSTSEWTTEASPPLETLSEVDLNSTFTPDVEHSVKQMTIPWVAICIVVLVIVLCGIAVVCCRTRCNKRWNRTWACSAGKMGKKDVEEVAGASEEYPKLIAHRQTTSF